jgi:DnaJ homolog subfamily C member 28
LNRILQRQGAAPPWVQAQVDLTSTFAQFRESLRTEWLRYITRQLTSSPGNLTSHIATAESYVQRDKASNYKSREYRSDWESREEKFHLLAIQDLNAKTRSYNTIAPYTARKPYTTLSRELEDCYRDVAARIVDAIRNRPPPSKTDGPIIRGAVAIFEDLAGPKKPLHVNREGEFGLMDFFKTLLKRESN